MYGGEITHNVAHYHIRPAIPVTQPIQLDGGGIQMAGGIFHLRGPEPKLIAYNTSVRHGGGINWVAGQMDTSANTGPLHIRNNRAAENGGGMFIRGSGFVVDEHITISDNTAGQNGGGIHLSYGNLTIDGGVIRENGSLSRSVTLDWRPILGSCNPTDPGHPAINACNNPNCSLVDIETVSGGGVFISGGTVTMLDGEIEENYARHSGGGVFSTGGNFNMSGGDIVDNTARGILADDSLAPADQSGGGGVFMTGGSFTMSGTDPKNITHNTALNGGGVHVSGGGSFTMATGGNIAHNNAPDLGTARGIGVRMSGGDFLIDAGVIRANIRTAATPSYGGGVYVSGGTVTMNGGTIGGPALADRNEANVSGGGAFVSGGNFLMSGGTIQGNRALGTLITQGGGGTFVAGGNFEMTGTDPKNIINNHALNGGGVYVADGGNMTTITGGSISNSTTPVTGISHGVGVHISGGTLTMNGGVISNNIRAGTPNSYGGGVFITGGGTFNMFDGTIYGNEASNGGGVRVEDDSNLNLFPNPGPGPDPIIRSNTAVTNGGGVSVADDSTFIMSGGTIGGTAAADRNIAAQRGGGVYINDSTFTMQGGSIVNNEVLGTGYAASAGGGVFITDGSTFTLLGGAISGNRGANFGGGVRVLNSNFIMQPGVSGNGATISGNTALRGGGVSVQGTTVFTMNSGTISGNGVPQPNPHPSPAPGYLILQTRYGGGVFIHDADTIFSMHNNSVITGNIASRQGGGIFITAGDVVATGGNISYNIASNTGGAYVAGGPYNGSGGGIYVSAAATLSTANVNFTGNHAFEMGGAIFTEIYEYVRWLNLLSVPMPYSNLTIANTTVFTDNSASAPWLPPLNALGTGVPGGSRSIFNHPINNFDINFRLYGIPFSFIKTDNIIMPWEGNRLEGAVFQLYNRLNPGDPWVQVGGQVTSIANGTVTIPGTVITPQGQYRLVEVLAPNSFMTPFGYWLIDVTEPTPGNFVINTTYHGGNPPIIPNGGYWWVGNRLDFDLPLTGGRGTFMSLHAGTAIFIIAAGIAVFFTFKRKHVLH